MSLSPPSRGSARSQPPDWQASRHRHVLLEDSELYAALPERSRDRAVSECHAEVIALAPGEWPSRECAPRLCEGGLGLLILDGLVLCRRGIDGRYGAELLGAGDLLRPAQEAQESCRLPLHTSRRVLAHARVAVLDSGFAKSMAPYPELSEELLARAINRSRNLAVLMAIVHQPRIDNRLESLFWHLASRWGKIRPDGVLVPLRLTHAVLADLVAARRPSVSSALAELSRRDVVRASEEGWHLRGEPSELAAPSGDDAAFARPAGPRAAATISAREPRPRKRLAHTIAA
ncbi:MAG: helix-turn-helix domain-containing protein [Solirubrobacteraceae bacterium]